ncbi:MAG: glycosyltransferase family 2 protein [Myxococcaceae bacterium]|nr:glycosyltransferase family 2 protein [Myxococcaceae bacterium]
MAAQLAQDLRTVVTRRVGGKRRVVVLASDLALVRAIEANGCTVLADPASLDEVAAFRPEVVVVFDGFVLRDGQEALRRLASASGEAELVFSFANAASASALLAGLLGLPPAPAFSEPEVRRWLASAGFVVASRDAVVTAPVATGLSADTEAALRQLFEQLNPDAAIDRLLLVARRGVEATKPDRSPGLVSVIVSGGADVAALEGTLSSLANQHRRPLELVVVAALPAERLDEVVSRARVRSGISVITKADAPTDPAARTNAGLALAQGQYVAFAEEGTLFSPMHLTSLVRLLEDGTVAWALTSSATSARGAARPARFDLGAWLRDGLVHRAEWLIDTSRLASFPLTFAEGERDADALLFARLGLLFPPAWRPDAPTVELSTPPSFAVDALLAKLRGRPLRGLTTLDALVQPPPVPALAAQVQERLAAVDPRVAEAFARTRNVLGRVQDAWEKARVAADAERKP